MQRVAVALLGLALCLTVASAQKCQPSCRNGGVCTASENGISYCKCKAGYMGEQCTATYQECKKGLVCYNGGSCVPDPNKPDQEMCSCTKDWAGATCKVPHKTCGSGNDTSTLACMNGGECTLDEAANEWFCACPPNLRGRQCQLGVAECKDGMFCMNNARCAEDGHGCICPGGFFGLHCQNDERDAFVDLIPRKQLPGYAVALIVLACLVAVSGISLVVFLYVRERRGRPYFKSWQQGGSGLQGTL